MLASMSTDANSNTLSSEGKTEDVTNTSNGSNNSNGQTILKNVGYHTGKLKTIYLSITEYVNTHGMGMPCQIFLGEPRFGKRGLITETDLEQTSKFLSATNTHLFIHSFYCINLCKPETKKNPQDTKWALNLLMEDLKYAKILGALGVVVHVGKSLTIPKKTALEKMIFNIKSCLSNASEECPLLIETPAGQGTELCQTIEEFIDLYKVFTDEERKVFKVCLDTQHVFSCGYDPIEYLVKFTSVFGCESIRLIHLNDSAVQCGKHADRHAFIGKGYIGLPKLLQCIEWATEHKVKMVIE